MALLKFTPPESTPAPEGRTWRTYNAAQVSEKSTFMELLADLCATVPQPEYRFGRPRLPLADMVFTGATKVFSGFSARRFSSDVREAHTKGFTSATPHFNSVNRYIANPNLTPILKRLIEVSAIPLSAVETDIAVDASGFATTKFARWHEYKWGGQTSRREWLKAHIACGVLTNVVTAIEITGGNVHDSLKMEALLDSTAERFEMGTVCADKAYLSDAILRRVVEHGAYPYIPFKSNSTQNGSTLWKQLYAAFVVDQSLFFERYHKRSNVETTFSMVKAKFGDSVRSKSATGQVNEILLKFLCHNLVVLVRAMHDLGINPSFEPKVLYLNH